MEQIQPSAFTLKEENAAFDLLFKDYKYKNPNFECECSSPMQSLCVSNCGQTSLHCSNRQCAHSHLKHRMCRVIYLKGLTQLLQIHFASHRSFLSQLFEIEQAIVAQIRHRREVLVNSLRFGGFEDQQRVAIEQIYLRKNPKFCKGVNINQLYKKLLLRKDKKRQVDIQIEYYRSQLECIRSKLLQMRQATMKHYLQSSKTFDSVILMRRQPKYQEKMDFILDSLQRPKGFQLLYRGSEHQFSAAKFYECCDRIENVLVIVKTEFGKIIGGFNRLGWNSKLHSQWSPDPDKNCFLFSLNLKQKIDLVDTQKAIYNNRQTGPFFGVSDLGLADRCNILKNSISSFPISYNFTSKPYISNQQTWTAFSGATASSKFGVLQYEVFKVIR